MPITLRIDVIPKNLKTRKIVIPDKCPKCGQDFTDPDDSMLREIAFTSTSSDCHIETSTAYGETEEKPHLDYVGDSKTYFECQHIVGYECANCDHDLTKKFGS